MSFLSRLSARTRFAAAAAPSLMPKGFVARSVGSLHREEAPAEDEEQVAPLRVRRARALRRETPVPEEGEEEMSRAPAAGPAEAPPEEETMQPLRRAQTAAPEEEEVQAVRRAGTPAEGTEEEEAVRPARFLRRAEEVPLDETDRPLRQPFQSDLQPGAATPPPELATEEEPSGLQALRREAVPASPAAPGRFDRPAHALAAWDPPEPASGLPDSGGRSDGGAAAPFQAQDWPASEPRGAAPADRPQVIIDRLDVLIHEPAPSRAAAGPATDRGRLLRARYLRRL